MQSPIKQHLAHAIRCHEAGNLTEAEGLYREILRQEPEHPDALYFLGVLAHQAGRPEAALDLLVRVGKRNKRNVYYHLTLGNVYRSLGRLEEAARALREALRIKPDFAEAHSNLGIVLQLGAHLSEAYEAYQRALRLRPDSVADRINAGNILQEWGRLDEAAQFYQGALNLAPNSVEASNNLGNVLLAQGRYDQARECFARALSLDPTLAEAYYNMGNALKEQGEWDAAIEWYGKALSLRPAYAEAYINMGNALRNAGREEEAVKAYLQVRTLRPDFIDAWVNLGNTLLDLGKLEGAVETLLRAQELAPTNAEIICSLSLAYQKQGLLDAAEQWLRRAIELKPGHAIALNNMGTVYLDQGRLTESVDAFSRALAIKPDYIDAARNLLMATLYLPELDEASRFEAHQLFEQRFGASCKGNQEPFANRRETEKRLRIGYVSSDFRDHPVARNLEPLIAHRDRSRFEVYLYGNVKNPDEITERFKQAADGWRSILGLSDEAVARKIREDALDILVLLAGRFDANRPLIAAYRAAPVQVSLHDPATSGLKAMDYLIADAQLAPRNTLERFTERVVHLPAFYLHAPMTNVPDIAPLPARERGYLTFGSFNNPAKLNERVVALWAEVLKAVPGSKLLLKYKAAFGVASVRARYLKLFEACGISAERLILVGEIDRLSQHLGRYSEIDIALDPFPFTGSTTTFEALWMGVPVITLAGDTMVSRWSMAMLKKVKLDELIAHSEDEYVAIAQRLAGDLAHLSELRAGLRERVKHSPLCDEAARTRQIERAYRWMWRKWCATENMPLSPSPS